jgi:hypothetical protein
VNPFRAAATLLLTTALVGLACGGSSGSSTGPGPASDAGPRGAEPAGQACASPAQCYGGTDGGVVGEVTCITKVTNGYCTHKCVQDTDCCAAAGECPSGVKEVCAPFENQAAQYCFLSCEDADIQRAIAANAGTAYYDGGATEAGSTQDAYCRSYAGASTSCRSTGGGSKNRKVCIPI